MKKFLAALGLAALVTIVGPSGEAATRSRTVHLQIEARNMLGEDLELEGSSVAFGTQGTRMQGTASNAVIDARAALVSASLATSGVSASKDRIHRGQSRHLVGRVKQSGQTGASVNSMMKASVTGMNQCDVAGHDDRDRVLNDGTRRGVTRHQLILQIERVGVISAHRTGYGRDPGTAMMSGDRGKAVEQLSLLASSAPGPQRKDLKAMSLPHVTVGTVLKSHSDTCNLLVKTVPSVEASAS